MNDFCLHHVIDVMHGIIWFRKDYKRILTSLTFIIVILTHALSVR